MDINLIRSIVTVLSMLVFIGIVLWAYSKQQKARFDAAAQSILEDTVLEKDDLLKVEGK
jgi:cytochrome c oxidase cbb3-type subunit 4